MVKRGTYHMRMKSKCCDEFFESMGQPMWHRLDFLALLDGRPFRPIKNENSHYWQLHQPRQPIKEQVKLRIFTCLCMEPPVKKNSLHLIEPDAELDNE